MFETLKPAAPDGILALMAIYRDDPRTDKLDLGIGVYKTPDGHTPIMRAVREAEQRLYREQTTKTYLGLAGDVAFNAAMIGLVFGERADRTRLRAAQTPGGTGALRMLADLIRLSRPDATVWVPDPTWPNHLPILKAAGLAARVYPYFDAATGGIRFDAMIEALAGASAGDVVLLHGCCHNPTGADLDLDQWRAIADLLAERGLMPFVDIAYQGFGAGLDEDAAGLRLLADKVPELVAAASCSKNFSVYRDRAGAAILMGRNAAEADIAYGQLLGVGRGIWSMPPDHAAACVRIVLSDAALEAPSCGLAPPTHTPARGLRRCAAAPVQLRPLRLHHPSEGHVLAARPHAGPGDAPARHARRLHHRRQPLQRRRTAWRQAGRPCGQDRFGAVRLG